MAKYWEFEPEEPMRKLAEARLANPDFSAVKPRLAATVMLVAEDARDAQLHVFMMQRASTMKFAPDAVVFPGGSVSSSDYERVDIWEGPSPAEWASLLRRSEDEAVALVTTAARELFEECGVLLAGSLDGHVLAGAEVLDLHGKRADLAQHRLSFAEFLRNESLAFRSDLLAVQSNIVTPDFVERRYDTVFFSARLPEGQTPDGKTSEAVTTAWATPESVVEASLAGKLHLLQPTRYNLEIIQQANDIAHLMQGSFDGEVLRPAAFLDKNGVLKVGIAH